MIETRHRPTSGILVVLGIASLLLAGCITAPGKLDPLKGINNQFDKEFTKQGTTKHELQFIQDFEKKVNGTTKKNGTPYSDPDLKYERNRIISGLTLTAETVHSNIDSKLRSSRAGLNTFFDAAQITTATLGALFTPASTVRILSGSSAAFKGFQESVDKRWFYEHATSALVAEMKAQRATAKKPLLSNSVKSINDYPLEAALADWATFFLAGSVVDALSVMGSEATQRELKELKILNDIQALMGKVDNPAAVAEAEAAKEAAKVAVAKAEKAESVSKLAEESIQVEKSRIAKILNFVSAGSGTIDNGALSRLVAHARPNAPNIFTNSVQNGINSKTTRDDLEELLFEDIPDAIPFLYDCLPTDKK